MRNKKAKSLRRLGSAVAVASGQPFNAKAEYKKAKKIYKATKGEL